MTGIITIGESWFIPTPATSLVLLPFTTAHVPCFWNESESKLQAVKHDPDPKRLDAFFDRYLKNSRPKTGWNGEGNLDHFSLIGRIHHAYPDFRAALSAPGPSQFMRQVKKMLDNEFGPLMSPLRGR